MTTNREHNQLKQERTNCGTVMYTTQIWDNGKYHDWGVIYKGLPKKKKRARTRNFRKRNI